MKDARVAQERLGAKDDPEKLKLGDPLLDAAAELFNRRDFADVTVEEAARRADVDVMTALQRFPSAAYLARGIYEAVLDKVTERIADPEATLKDSLCAFMFAEIQTLMPYKPFVARSILELVKPTSMQLLVQMPTMQRQLAMVTDQISVARSHGRVGRWVIPNVAATCFGLIHAQIVTYWLTIDTSPSSQKTFALIESEMDAFTRVLEHPLGFLKLDRLFGSAPVTHRPYKTQPIAGSASRGARPSSGVTRGVQKQG